jgi:hypothetical protein
MTDTRRLGHAQRRRVGAPSNVYDDTIPAPTHGVGDVVRAKGRYRDQTIVDIIPAFTRPIEGVTDGHGYVVEGGKRGRRTVHLSSEMRRF